MTQSHLSRSALERLHAELEERAGPTRRAISERIEQAREHGDLRENAEYHAAKNEQGLNEARIRQLEQMLRDVVVVEVSDAEVVAHGTVVTIHIEGDDEPQEYLIGSIEERHETYEVLSTSSALGQELLGKRSGEESEYTTPRGKPLTVKVVSIRPLD
jgi:transcription elongation factor GreA